MTRFERKKKRKDMRRAQADQERETKLKKTKNDTPKKRPANYRKGSDGSIILFGAIKISKISWVVLGIIALVGIYFAIAFHHGEQLEDMPPVMSFEECELNEFRNDMCKLDYKFCRTYADGKTICQYAENNPFVNVDEEEKFYAPEEQDFLPPVQFIAPLISWADARSDDEPICYSQICKNENPEVTNNKEKTVKELNRDVLDIRKEIDKVEDELSDAQLIVQQWVRDEVIYDNRVNSAERDYEDYEEKFKDAETNYRHAMDVKVRSDEDIKLQKDALDEYKRASIDLNNAKKEYEKAKKEHDEKTEEYWEAYKLRYDLEDKLEELLDELSEARIHANIVHRDNQFISITLSQACLTAIKNDVNQNCPTYRELRDAFDNTVPLVSGEFVDLGYDIKREESKYQNYWNYYKQMKSWKIITVDPDTEMSERSMNIIIQPSAFSYVENVKTTSKNESINIHEHERYIWRDLKVSDRCNKALVSPDMDTINKAINHFLSNCNSELTTRETVPMPLSVFDIVDSSFHRYANWLAHAQDECKVKCN
jgi:hypothetical protein